MQVKGKPLAFYAMNAAFNSKYIKHRFLSIDDESIEKYEEIIFFQLFIQKKLVSNYIVNI